MLLLAQADRLLLALAGLAPGARLLGPLQDAQRFIQQTLTGQSQTSAQSAVDGGARKQWLKQTKCRSGYAMADCSGYKAPKGQTQTTPGQPQPTPGPSTTGTR